jgi:predicted nucleotidyltransferase
VGAPTPFPELNALLDEFVADAHAILSDNFCSAYLQGSFAVGDADEHSDVDFIVATNGEVTERQRAELQAMHQRLYGHETHWAQHLEGSYVPKASLRRVDPERRAFLYLDNGSTELELDNHCNTHVVRWSLREHGISLAGPDADTLVDPVPADGMRGELAVAIREYADWAPAPTQTGGMSEWKQTFLVLMFCRMLHSLESGRVVSKRAAGEWALGSLDPAWQDLIQRALDDRPDPWERTARPAEPALAERTLAFADYAARRAA